MKSVLMFTKDNEWCRIAREFVAANFDAKFIILPKDQEVYWHMQKDWDQKEIYDYVISYLCPQILPEWVLKLGKVAINFHPAPPKYPGIGGYNFAIYNQDKEYACTLHFMDEKVDSGKIIAAHYFELIGNETVQSLKERTMIQMLDMFFDFMRDLLDSIRDNEDIFTQRYWCNRNDREWEHEPYTRADLQKLCEVDLEDYVEDQQGYTYKREIGRQLRATYFPNALDGPYIEINNKKWRLIPENE